MTRFSEHNCNLYPDPSIETKLRKNGRDIRGYPWGKMNFHEPLQDTECEAWLTLLNAIDRCAESKSEYFSPWHEMGSELWMQIRILPSTIYKLKHVRQLELYGSNLVQIPPEIGCMENLERFDIYTSYGLHWLPYEIMQCKKIKDVRVSIRALYGNFKNRPPFPKLPSKGCLELPVTSICSVCGKPMKPLDIRQFWISLSPINDLYNVVPLLVNGCSKDCVANLPKPPDGYIRCPHKGGARQKQPAPGFKHVR